MSRLIIRDVDGATMRRLRVRARRHGRSVETEFRAILIDALEADMGGEPNLAESIRRRVAPLGGVELEEHPPVLVREPPAFDP